MQNFATNASTAYQAIYQQHAYEKKAKYTSPGGHTLTGPPERATLAAGLTTMCQAKVAGSQPMGCRLPPHLQGFGLTIQRRGRGEWNGGCSLEPLESLGDPDAESYVTAGEQPRWQPAPPTKGSFTPPASPTIWRRHCSTGGHFHHHLMDSQLIAGFDNVKPHR